MNTTTKGIIGAVGAAAIGVGAYFGFSGGEDEFSDLKNVLNKYSASINDIPDTDDTKVLNNNVAFITWSWQKFLHLMGGPKERPYFLTELKQVNDFAEIINYDSLIKHNLDSNLIRDKQNLPIILDLFQQADGVILRGKDDGLVRYSIHANDKLINTIHSPAVQSIIDKVVPMLLDSNQVQPIYDNKNTYPVGATEIKIAWIPTKSVFDPSKTYNVKAIVNDHKSGEKDYSKAVEEEMTMIGFHLFTVTEQHPEGVWSTFDLYDLAPDRETYSKKANVVAPTNGKEYILCSKDGGVENGIEQDLSDSTPYVAMSVFQSHPAGVRYDDKHSAMIPLSEVDSTFLMQLDSSNAIVKAALKGNVWSNYKLVGSIWSKTNEDIDNLLHGALNVENGVSTKNRQGQKTVGKSFGSLNNSNVALETTFQANGLNCFTCHSMNNNLYRKSNFKGENVPNINLKSPLVTSHLMEKFVEVKAYMTYVEVKKSQATNSPESSNDLEKYKGITLQDVKNFIRKTSREDTQDLLK